MIAETLRELLSRRPVPFNDIASTVASVSNTALPQDFDSILELASYREDYMERARIPALAVLPAWGRAGISALKTIAGHDDMWRSQALSVLLSIAMNERPSNEDLMFLPKNWNELCSYKLLDDTVNEARRAVQELVLDQIQDFDRRAQLFTDIGFIMNVSMMSQKDADQPIHDVGPKQVEKADYFFRALIDPRLMLNERLIREFEELLGVAEKERELHEFLFEHPIFLDPLAIEIRSKHELGDDFQTDFVIKRINDDYVVVEIEKSTDKVFTEKGNFHSLLTDSVRQVRDFQSWISDNIEYARSKLPGIKRPEGLLVIGRRKDFDNRMARSLDEENFSRRGHIKIVTYDDLLEQAKVIYRNMLERPLMIKGKEVIS